jgi:O-antigen/teichoic acid export membrane protein
MPLSAVLEANERFDYVTVITILGRLLFFLIGGIVLFTGRSYIALILASIIIMPLQIVLSTAVVGRHDLAKLKPSIQITTWPTLLRRGLPFGIISLFLTIAFSIDTVMLSWFEQDYVVGWYNVAYGLIPSITFFFTGFKRAIVPSLARTYVNDPGQVNRWYYGSVKFILLSSIPIAVGGMIVAFPLIDFLYGQEFLPAAFALQILIWDVPFLMFASFAGNMTTIVSEEKAAAKIYGINTLANVVLNLYAIPQFGLVGAAIVTVITDLIGALQFYFLLKRKMELQSITSIGIRILLASALMGGILLLVGDLNLFLLIGLGAVVYLGLILLFRVINHEELTLLRRSVHRFLAVIRIIPPSDERIHF